MFESASLPRQAAKASWMAPLLAAGLGILGSAMTSDPAGDAETARTTRFVIAIIALLIVLVGLLLGVAALFGIRRHGMQGILLPAVIGIALSSGYLYLVISTFLLVQKLMQERGISP